MSSAHGVTLKVLHNKKRTNVSFNGTLPVLDAKEEPHKVVLNGPCGIVSDESSEYLFTVGSFGTKVAEDALERYVQIQGAVLRCEDVPCSDMFFLLDSVRRSHRRKHEELSAENADSESPHTPMDVLEASIAPPEDESDHTPLVESAPSPGSSGAESDVECTPDAAPDSPSPDPSAPAGDTDTVPAARRRLVLQPEEVLFLSHGLGCVRVTAEEGAELAGERLYRHLAARDRHLAERYAAYLELRGRGWVVRDGLLSGADFVVYKRGPAFYHASLVVTIQVVSAETRQVIPERNWRTADWLYTAGLCRTAEQAAKDVLLVRLLWPAGLGQPADLSYLSQVGVQHVLVRRWTPSRSAGLTS